MKNDPEKSQALTRRIVELRSGDSSVEICVDLASFFDGNNDRGSLGCNLLDDHPSIPEMHRILRKLKDNKLTQDVLIRIYEAPWEENWAYTDTVYILTKATRESIELLRSKLLFDEIHEGWMYGQPTGAPTLEAGNVVYCLWWD